MKYTLNITQEMIDKGDTCYGSCPIALAGMAAGMFSPYVTVHYLQWYADKDHLDNKTRTRFAVELPLEAKMFIHSHDNRRQGKPFSFEVEVP